MADEFWNYRLRLHSYTFYERRPQFVRTLSAFGDWVLIAPENGAFDYDTGSERGHAAPGDLVFAAPHTPLWRSATATPFTYHVLQWSFEKVSEKVSDKAMWQPGKWMMPDTARLFEDYALLRTYYGRSDEWARRRIENILEELLLLAHAARHAAPIVSDPTMREAARMLRERAAQVFSMVDISDAVGLKPVQFTRRFRKTHGTTPIEYLTRVRLENARRLLIETDASLDEIAEQCGWSSGYYLSSVFKNAFDLAPGQFRRLHRV